MPAYHSQFNNQDAESICGMAVLPLKSGSNGPAQIIRGNEDDIIDEAIKLYRANVLFSSFDISGDADRTLLYLTLFISQGLVRLQKAGNKNHGFKILNELGKEKFPIPGESGWQLGGYILTPNKHGEAEQCRNFMKQLREEICARLVEVLYADSDAAPNKFWMGFSKRKFMNILVR